MIRGNIRNEIVMIGKRHAGMVHGIAELTLFGYGCLILRSLVRFVFHQVLMGIYHHLSRCKAE
jgi:hypothetical protein